MKAASSKPAWTGLLVLLLVSLVAGAQEDDTPDEDEKLAPVVASARISHSAAGAGLAH
jgi:hypothetical protein